MCSNSDFLTVLLEPLGLNIDDVDLDLGSSFFLKKYCPGSTKVSPMALDLSFSNVSKVPLLGLFKTFLTFPHSARSFP